MNWFANFYKRISINFCKLNQLMFFSKLYSARRCSQESPQTSKMEALNLRDLVPFAELKNMKNTHGGVLLLVKCRLQFATLLKVTFLHGCFSRSVNCTNRIKSCRFKTVHLRCLQWVLASHLQLVLIWLYFAIFEMRCAIWYYLGNFKNLKNTHGGVLLLLKLQAKVS